MVGCRMSSRHRCFARGWRRSPRPPPSPVASSTAASGRPICCSHALMTPTKRRSMLQPRPSADAMAWTSARPPSVIVHLARRNASSKVSCVFTRRESATSFSISSVRMRSAIVRSSASPRKRCRCWLGCASPLHRPARQIGSQATACAGNGGFGHTPKGSRRLQGPFTFSAPSLQGFELAHLLQAVPGHHSSRPFYDFVPCARVLAMSRIRPSRFVHVVYRTRQFDKMIAWYQAVFDCKVQYQNPVLAFLTYDDEHHRVALLNLSVVAPDAPADERRGAVGVDHVAYTYDSVDALIENYAQLKEKGILPYWCIHHGVTMSMYYADPDGNQMELQVDAFASADEPNAFMHGPGM